MNVREIKKENKKHYLVQICGHHGQPSEFLFSFSTTLNPTLPGRFWYLHSLGGGADNICKTIEFLIDNIFLQFGGLFFQMIGGALIFSLFFKLCLPNLVRGNNV